jgi:hypothetical protein
MRKFIRKIVLTLLGVLLIGVVVAGLYLFWYSHRPLPAEMRGVPLFQGITYTRELRAEPRPLVIHIVKIDLDAPGIKFIVTPGDKVEGYDYIARTTSQFLQEFGVQLAINGDAFAPWWEYGPFDYYPHEGDSTNARGLTVSQGRVVTHGYSPVSDSVYISQDNHVTFTQPPTGLYNVISGLQILVREGSYSPLSADPYLEQPHPRTAVALSQDERTFIIVLVDGRQPNYSEGVSMAELAQIVIDAGGYNALNLDGGESTALIIQGQDGQPLQLGSAIHTRIPGRERPVANHLGIFAQPLP